MNPTIAIVGSHPETRELFDFTRTDCDVWVFNEALGNTKDDWCNRADGVFQMHVPTVWRTSVNRNDPNHYEWLKTTNVTVFMQDIYPDVPASERYPLDEVLALTPGFRYLTSSVAEAIALAIHKGYARIEIYGAEMETGTEYGHQRQGMAFWIGVAVGRGIEVQHHSPRFWKAPLYGYEGITRLDMSVYRDRIEDVKEHAKAIQQKHDLVGKNINGILSAFVQDYKADQSQLDTLIVQAGQTGHDFGMIDSASQVNEKYLDRCETMLKETGDYLIVRQELEGNMRSGIKEKDERFREVHVASDRLGRARKKLLTNVNREERIKLAETFTERLAAFIKASTLTGMGAGIMQENARLLDLYDRTPATEPIKTPMEEDLSVLEADLENMSDHR